MRMVPTELGTEEITTSERRVFEALAGSPLSGTALHSLNLPDHEYKLTAELDFVLILDDLILAVEVKGGQVSCRDGLWTYSDRAGHRRTSREGPFKQVQTAMYALRERLRERLGVEVDDVAFGYLVVTPDVDLASSFEWDDETYCGRGPFNRGIAKAIDRARKYWLGKQANKFPIGKELRARLMHDLRPSFDRSPLLDARANLLDAAMVRLTDEQYARLDLISDEPRVICSGGAGTGKTFLAAEVARRQALTRSARALHLPQRGAGGVRHPNAGRHSGRGQGGLETGRRDSLRRARGRRGARPHDLRHLGGPGAGRCRRLGRRSLDDVPRPEQPGPPLRRLRSGRSGLRPVVRTGEADPEVQLSEHSRDRFPDSGLHRRRHRSGNRWHRP